MRADLGTLAADALSELARLSLEGAARPVLAACATGWLERMVLGCRAVVVEAAPGTDEAVVVSDTGASGMHLHARFSFAEGSAIASAYREPLKAFHATGADLESSVSGYSVGRAESTVLVCAGVMGNLGARAVLAALINKDVLAKTANMDAALLILASQLAVASSVAKSRAAVAAAYEGITRAKVEWEGTVDALGEVVCLLDDDGRIVRANRVVEQWGLGAVAEVIGRQPHDVFHPDCRLERCALQSSILESWKSLRHSGPTEFDCQEDQTDRVLHFSFRPLLADVTISRTPGATPAVLVIDDVSELHRAREALTKLNVSLEQKVRARTQEMREANRGLRNEVVRRKAVEDALRASHSELGILSEQLIVAQENERHRIARELHDGVGQSLGAIKYSMERAAELVRRPDMGDPMPALMQAIRGIQETSESIRTIATSLRPTILDDMGAASAVAGFCRQFADVYKTIAVEAQVTATDAEIPDRLATAVFRSAQELLNNVAKHAQAGQIFLVLRREPNLLVLEVRDDGVGIAARPADAPPQRGHGLRNLRERAEMSGGLFALLPGRVRGTVARIKWPISHDESTAEVSK
jgi:signal transduction histidine kinase